MNLFPASCVTTEDPEIPFPKKTSVTYETGKWWERIDSTKKIRKPERIHFKYRSPKIVMWKRWVKNSWNWSTSLSNSKNPIKKKKKKPFDLDRERGEIKLLFELYVSRCMSRSCVRGKASRWNVAKHHRGKLLNSDRASRTVEAVERREKKWRRGRGEGRRGASLVCRNLAAEALDWRTILLAVLAETIETFPPGLLDSTFN